MKKITLAILMLVAVLKLQAQENNLLHYGTMLLTNAEQLKVTHPNEIEIIAINDYKAAVSLSKQAITLLHEINNDTCYKYTYASNEKEAIEDLRKIKLTPQPKIKVVKLDKKTKFGKLLSFRNQTSL